ncbi:MAG TPA: sigma-70 family RNA polymerase sigma factor [Kofleriaceae bacterium]|nr:sigma-70 family RNA polymerase sigma factor [Kofleriaceae bacterium]
MTEARAAVERAFRSHERFLWSLCYRMTGSSADADDLVQDTFARAIARPPADLESPLRPWLVRVAMNLARDLLRQRRRRRYLGTWLPAPVGDAALALDDAGAGGLELPPAHEPAETAARYDLMESVTTAFLLALEALSPPQRAVLILRDVLDYSVAETAAALAFSEANVKTTHHRARRAMQDYDGRRCRPSPELTARTSAALRRFLLAVRAQDASAVEALLAADVVARTDGGGEFVAAREPILGPRKVSLLYAKLSGRRDVPELRSELRLLNGLPAIVVEDPHPPARWAPRWTIQVEIGDDGLIRAVHSVLAIDKLRGLPAIGAAP